MALTFTPLSRDERTRLIGALRGNADKNLAILVDRKDTSFAGTAEDRAMDEEVIDAVRSIPCHYAR